MSSGEQSERSNLEKNHNDWLAKQDMQVLLSAKCLEATVGKQSVDEQMMSKTIVITFT